MKKLLPLLAAAFIPAAASAQSALTDALKDGTSKLAVQIGAERQERAAARSPEATIRRTSCDNDNVSVEVDTGRTIRSHQASLETSSSWQVGGKTYDLVYYYVQSDGRLPYPILGQLVSQDSPEGRGTKSITDARVLMQLPRGGYQDVPVHRETYRELDPSGQGTLYSWVNGAVGSPLTSATQTKLPDGGVQTVSRELDQEARDGWRDGGSVNTCTIRAMSRDAWLAMVADPAMGTEIATLDALSAAVDQAERSGSPGVDAQKQAFLAEWNSIYDGRKNAMERKLASIRRRRARQHARAANQCDGICAALQAIQDAKEQSARNAQEQAAQELERIREDLERRRP